MNTASLMDRILLLSDVFTFARVHASALKLQVCTTAANEPANIFASLCSSLSVVFTQKQWRSGRAGSKRTGGNLSENVLQNIPIPII